MPRETCLVSVDFDSKRAAIRKRKGSAEIVTRKVPAAIIQSFTLSNNHSSILCVNTIVFLILTRHNTEWNIVKYSTCEIHVGLSVSLDVLDCILPLNNRIAFMLFSRLIKNRVH